MRALYAALALVVFGFGRRALADEPRPRIAVLLEGCDDPAGIERIARLELRADRGDVASTTIRATCTSERATLDVDDRITGKRLERVVAFGATPLGLRPRLLALAIAELVRSSWLEVDSNPTPVLPPVATAPVPKAEIEAARRIAVAKVRAESPWRGSVGLSFVLSESLDPMIALELGVRRRIIGPLALSVTLGLAMGEASRTLGSVRTTWPWLDLGGAWFGGRVSVEIAARVSYAWLSGEPSDGAAHGAVAGIVAGPIAKIGVRLIGPLRADLEGGYLGLGVRGNVATDAPVVVSGPLLSLGLGLGM